MSDDNPFSSGDASLHISDDPEFDEQLAKMWMGRTWGATGGALGIVALSFCCNPFGIVGLIAVAACLAAILRSFMPPPVVKPFLRGRNIAPAVLSVIGGLLSIGASSMVWLGTLLASQ